MTSLGYKQQFLRPVIVATLFTVLGESLLLIVFGMWLFPGGSLPAKALWTLGLCGVGMGIAIGTLLGLVVVPRWDGVRAIAAGTVIAFVTLGIGCNVLCFYIDQRFNYFGGVDQPDWWLARGVSLSIVGGVLIGLPLFTEPGRRILSRVGF